MEFNKSRVYTALNADELEVGSMVIVADVLQVLKNRVKNGNKCSIFKLDRVVDDTYRELFYAIGISWALAYLVSPPESKKTPRYKPFSNSKAAYEAIAAHGGWIKKGCTYHFITWIDIGRADGNEICFYGNWHSARSICENCTFADDGTPVGERIEDSDTEEDGGNE